MKFRIWSKLGQRFESTSLFSLNGDGKLVDNGGLYESYEKMEKDLVVSFWIGLKETYPNGTYIYDGDIIEGFDINERSKVVAVVSADITYGVFYIKPSDYQKYLEVQRDYTINFEGKIYSLAQEYDFKVIGNIFENPELLNKK